MTVAELIQALSSMPLDAEVELDLTVYCRCDECQMADLRVILDGRTVMIG